jgi:hypothetical protein
MSVMKVYAEINQERENALSQSERLFAKEKCNFYTKRELVHHAAILIEAIMLYEKDHKSV